MTTRFLWLERNSNQLHLRNEAVPPLFSSDGILNRYRVSPIFPVLPDSFVDPDFSQSGYIGFYFCCSEASLAIGRLLKSLDGEITKQLWFSHGLASVLLFTGDTLDLEAARVICGDSLRAYEKWSINSDGLISPHLEYLAPVSIENPDYYAIGDYGDLSEDLQVILSEFAHCFCTAVGRAARFVPGLLFAFRKLAETVNEIISELFFLEHPDQPPPPSLPNGISGIVLDNPLDRQRRIHQRTGWLVQLNSQLSYVISQAFSGMPPLLESECQIRSYSLLGVGTAFLSIYAFSRHVEQVFDGFPVEQVITDKFSVAAGVDVFPRLGRFNPDVWRSHRHRVDTLLEQSATEACKPKLVAFSGRQGFRETEFAVTVPLSVLAAADTARWTLMTLSHELMHGHVRALLAVIFADTQRRSSTEAFYDYYNAFRQFCRDSPPDGYTLLDSLRFAIFNYCVHEKIFEQSLTDRSRTGYLGSDSKMRYSIEVPTAEALWKVLSAEYREINEVMAHVLDYNYFYNCENELYLGVLWASWTPVPVVLEEIDRYLLRSIVTVATKETGTISERFDISLKIVMEQLNRLAERRPENLVAREAIRVLAGNTTNLLLQFTPMLYLADLTTQLLVSASVHSALVQDENSYVDTDGFHYHLDEGAFPGFSVESPVAFIADRLRRIILSKGVSLAQDQRTCWLLLTCASAYSQEGCRNVISRPA